MEVKNSLSATDEQLKGFTELQPDGPIYMVNLLKLKEHAEYEDGRETALSGAEAYTIYSDAVSKILTQFGGGMLFSAGVERLMLGEIDELWDVIAIVMYPSRQARVEMMQSEPFQKILVHREAGLAGQLNIETTGAIGEWTPKIS